MVAIRAAKNVENGSESTCITIEGSELGCRCTGFMLNPFHVAVAAPRKHRQGSKRAIL